MQQLGKENNKMIVFYVINQLIIPFHGFTFIILGV